MPNNSNSMTSDNEKRGKLIFLAGAIVVAMFVSKISQTEAQQNLLRIYLGGGVYFLFSFIGLLWAFKFQVKGRSFLHILQSSLFVLSEVLFVEFFFFQRFNRIYEILVLIFILILIAIGNYVSFLMANVFNVSLYKNIPLLQVGRTASYVLSLLMIYFFVFSFLVSGFPIYVLIPLVGVIVFFVTYIHYLNIGLEEGELWRKTLLTFLITFSLFLGSFLLGSDHELVSIVPVVGFFVCVSVVSQEVIQKELRLNMFVYSLIVITVFLMNLFLNIS
jgi:hypothetical protein